jgi:uncharacterized protein
MDFQGRGWSFPPVFNRHIPGVEMTEKVDDIVSSLEILMTTMPGERVMLPDYGCGMEDLIFESLDTRLKTLLADKIESTILYFEPRIEVENVELDSSRELEGVVLIEIIFRVKATNSRFNFVFPYYKQEGTDINLTTTVTLLPDNS